MSCTELDVPQYLFLILCFNPRDQYILWNIIIIIITLESLGPINASECAFLSKLGRKLSTQSGDDRETSFSFQRLSALIQRFNAILLLDSFVKEEE